MRKRSGSAAGTSWSSVLSISHITRALQSVSLKLSALLVVSAPLWRCCVVVRQDEAISYLRKVKGVDNPSQQQIHEAVAFMRQVRQQKQQQAQQPQQPQQQGQQQTQPHNVPPASASRSNPPISAHPQHPPPIAIPPNTSSPPQPPGPPLPAPMIQATLKAALEQSIRMSWKDLPQHLHLFQPESEGKALQVGLMKGMMGLGRVSGGRAAPPVTATVATAAAIVNGGMGDERKAGGGGSTEVSERVRDLLSEKSGKGSKKKDKERDRDREKSKKDKRNKEDKKRRSNDISGSPAPTPATAVAVSTSDAQQAAKRPKLNSSASSSSLASAASVPPPPPPPQPPLPSAPNVTDLSSSHETWKRSTDGMMDQLRMMREGRADTLQEMRRKKEETERLMREREEDEVKIREMRRAVEDERKSFDEERRARRQQDDEEDALMRAVWKEEEWYMDMNVMRRKVVQLLLHKHDALRLDDERVVELIALGCQQYVKGMVEEMVRVRSRRRDEEKDRWRREGRVVEGVDGLEEVKRRERLRAVEVEKRLKERERQRRRRLLEDGAIEDDGATMEDDNERPDDAMDGSNVPLPPPPAPSRSKAGDANKLTVADLVFVMERDGRLRRSERMWTVYGRLGLRMKDWPKEWQPPAQSVQSTYVDVSSYGVSNAASSSSSSLSQTTAVHRSDTTAAVPRGGWPVSLSTDCRGRYDALAYVQRCCHSCIRFRRSVLSIHCRSVVSQRGRG